ncbi:MULTISPECIES: hypothetical protein [Lysobacter]|uniref:hypothetical protein n=1 Tax=Lysobacter TaxID=68 RepID=UPI001F347910|nr:MULTISPECIES: hypothetical protein [Lysobacter]UJB19139.1 hypothetical protein L1A79_22970 [Lysobacter capsici]UJQ27136.1 hypothetical protein L2D09_16915 [Lysobacter gummosus]
MSRLHLIEFNDEPWTPEPLRRTVVEFLHHMAAELNMYRPGFERIAALLEQSGGRTVQLLCAGGGGGAQQLARALGPQARVLLSDRYPDTAAYAALEREDPRIGHIAAPVDVRDVPPELTGPRVIINAAHHLRPQELQAVLADAVGKRQPIVLIEPVQREWIPTLRFLLLAPLLCVAMSLGWIRPLSLRRTLLGVLLPVGTAAFLFDGVVSHLRAYSLDEWRALVAGLDGGGDFDWDIGQMPGALGSKLNVLVGTPREAA